MKNENNQGRKTKLTDEQLAYIKNDIDENLLFYRFLGFNGLKLTYADCINCAKKFQDRFPAYKSIQPEMIFFDYYRRLFFIPKIKELQDKCKNLGLNDITRVVDRNDYKNEICPKFKEYIIKQINNSNTLDKLVCIKFSTLEEREKLCDEIGYKLNGKDTVACILRAIRYAVNQINNNVDIYHMKLQCVNEDKELCGNGNRTRIIGLKYKVEFLDNHLDEMTTKPEDTNNTSLDTLEQKYEFRITYNISGTGYFKKPIFNLISSKTYIASNETDLQDLIKLDMDNLIKSIWLKHNRSLLYTYNIISKRPIKNL